MKYIDGTEARRGDVIRWHVFDSEENVTWEFTGLYRGQEVVYLGGGVGFGMGIGQLVPVEEVIAEAEANDEGARGVRLISSAHALANHIANIATY